MHAAVVDAPRIGLAQVAVQERVEADVEGALGRRGVDSCGAPRRRGSTSCVARLRSWRASTVTAVAATSSTSSRRSSTEVVGFISVSFSATRPSIRVRPITARPVSNSWRWTADVDRVEIGVDRRPRRRIADPAEQHRDGARRRDQLQVGVGCRRVRRSPRRDRSACRPSRPARRGRWSAATPATLRASKRRDVSSDRPTRLSTPSATSSSRSR